MKIFTFIVDFVEICTYNEINKLGGDKVNYRVAKELKAERVRRDLSIADVAKALETCGETIRRYESGTYTLTIEKIEKLLKFYNVDPSIFFRNVCGEMHD